ncbi:hypothetical protein G7085_09465 [Tessaracoccus sp. HDW20]|uniref:hypothetical protein n=1 Tax=Tessaracoccus coleopterorum TaxID=2714950 RepID=UPI0018D34FF7|nr:hypothetical protein [Tessaracoccus coleopterorum]NHB84760.1 hypothetical protein [Tessaracoccus coleopterorum]
MRACGGTIDLLRTPENLPGQGRPYRPSLIIDGMGAVAPTDRLGRGRRSSPWAIRRRAAPSATSGPPRSL